MTKDSIIILLLSATALFGCGVREIPERLYITGIDVNSIKSIGVHIDVPSQIGVISDRVFNREKDVQTASAIGTSIGLNLVIGLLATSEWVGTKHTRDKNKENIIKESDSVSLGTISDFMFMRLSEEFECRGDWKLKNVSKDEKKLTIDNISVDLDSDINTLLHINVIEISLKRRDKSNNLYLVSYAEGALYLIEGKNNIIWRNHKTAVSAEGYTFEELSSNKKLLEGLLQNVLSDISTGFAQDIIYAY